MRFLEAIEKVVFKLCFKKKMLEDMQKVKDKGGLQEKDWIEFIEQKHKYPIEVQTVLDAPNEEHVKLYQKDFEDINRIMEETKKLIKKEAPECIYLDYLDGSISMHKQEITVTTASVAEKEGINMDFLGNKLFYAAPYLYGSNSEVDIHLEAQVVYNSFLDLQDDALKNVKIAQKGKTGEDYVSRVLNQYRNNFFILENVVIPAYGEKGNTSETDVYLITSKGIFVCEVKNYGNAGQTLYIPERGEWPLYNSSGYLLSRKPSAFEQNERHCNATRSFIKEHLGMEVPIVPVVIIANDVVDICMENPNGNIVIRANQINGLVSEFQDTLSYETQKKIVEAFEKHQLDANDFPVKINADRAGYVKNLIKEYIPYIKANTELADIHRKHRKRSLWMSRIVMLLLAVLCMILSMEGDWLGILWGALLGVFIWATDNTVSWMFGVIAMIALQITIVNGSMVALLVTFFGTAASGYALSLKAKEPVSEN